MPLYAFLFFPFCKDIVNSVVNFKDIQEITIISGTTQEI